MMPHAPWELIASEVSGVLREESLNDDGFSLQTRRTTRVYDTRNRPVKGAT
jgi:hypothetical protein